MTSVKLEDYRMRWGLTQQQLADYLSVSRSTLSMAELRNRQLPVQAQVKFLELVSLYENMRVQETVFAATTDEQTEICACLQYEMGEVEWEIQVTERQLTQLQQKYQTYRGQQHLLGQACQQLTTKNQISAAEKQKDIDWFSDCGKITHQYLNECRMSRQLLLKVTIETFQFKLNRMRQLLEEQNLSDTNPTHFL